VVVGLVLVVVGLAWPWLRRIPLGRLPGDLVFEGSGYRVYVPITTMILVSVVLTLLLWIGRMLGR